MAVEFESDSDMEHLKAPSQAATDGGGIGEGERGGGGLTIFHTDRLQAAVQLQASLSLKRKILAGLTSFSLAW